MKKEYIIILVILVLIIGSGITIVNYQSYYREDNSPVTGDGDFAGFAATDFEGKKVDSGILKGHKINLINIWGTYCGPCIEEMPSLEKISKEYASDLQVIGICIDIADASGSVDSNTLNAAKTIVKDDTKVTYMNLIPSAEMRNGLLGDIQFIPTSYIVDENGMILDSFVGGKTESEFRSIIEKYK